MDNPRSNYDPRYEYWATLDIEDLLPVLMDKIDDYYEKLDDRGLIALWREMYSMNYGLTECNTKHDAHKIMFIGDNDEGIVVRSGHMRNILQHIYISATGQDPSWVCRAINNDLKSISQTYIGKSVLEYFMNEEKFLDAYDEATEICLTFAKGYVWQAWNLITDEPFAEAHTPLTVISDLSYCKHRKPLWRIVVERVNKWDIVAKYDVKEGDMEELFDAPDINARFTGFEKFFDSDEEDDYINVFHWYHEKSPTLPNGRYVAFTNDKYSLYPTKDSNDDRLPFEELPVYPIEYGRMILSPHGHTIAYDIAAHEKLHNISLSTIHSQLNKFAKKALTGPKNPSYEDYGGVEYFGVGEGEKPVGMIDMTPISDTLFKVNELEQKQIETLSSVGGPTRGSTEGMKSGSMAALYHSVTVQFQSGFLKQRATLLERCGTGLLRLLKEYYDKEKIIEIVGMDGEPYLKAFTKDDISLIDRVIVENGPAVLNTMAGKIHFADSMLEKGLITDPKDYQEILDTGQIQGLLTPTRHENAGIRAENELLMQPEQLHVVPMIVDGQPIIGDDGQPIMVVEEVRALITDDDPAHINEHKFLFMHPAHRQNPQLIQMALLHIKEHIWNAKNTPPDLMVALGKKPFPNQMQGPPSQPGPPGPQGPPRPQMPNQPGMNPQGGPPALSEQNLQQQAGSVPNPNYPVSGMPNLPNNPIG